MKIFLMKNRRGLHFLVLSEDVNQAIFHLKTTLSLPEDYVCCGESKPIQASQRTTIIAKLCVNEENIINDTITLINPSTS